MLVLVLGGSIAPNPRTGAKAQAPTVPTIDQKAVQPDALDLWIEKLVQVESGGKADIKVLDVNGKYSMGCLQYQQGTWDSYKPVLATLASAGQEMTPKLIYDCSLQKRLTKTILKQNPQKWRMWYNSVKKIGLPPEK